MTAGIAGGSTRRFRRASASAANCSTARLHCSISCDDAAGSRSRPHDTSPHRTRASTAHTRTNLFFLKHTLRADTHLSARQQVTRTHDVSSGPTPHPHATQAAKTAPVPCCRQERWAAAGCRQPLPRSEREPTATTAWLCTSSHATTETRRRRRAASQRHHSIRRRMCFNEGSDRGSTRSNARHAAAGPHLQRRVRRVPELRPRHWRRRILDGNNETPHAHAQASQRQQRRSVRRNSAAQQAAHTISGNWGSAANL